MSGSGSETLSEEQADWSSRLRALQHACGSRKRARDCQIQEACVEQGCSLNSRLFERQAGRRLAPVLVRSWAVQSNPRLRPAGQADDVLHLALEVGVHLEAKAADGGGMHY